MLTIQTTFQAKHYGPNAHSKKGPDAPRWILIDANDQVLGRISTVIANIIRGKHKPTYTRHADVGDFVIVINADKVVLTGNKWSQKKYYDYSNYVGGLKEKTAKELREKHPEELIRRAVWGMTNRSLLAKRQIKKLKIYAGDKHPHEAQNPQSISGGAVRKTVLAS